MATEIEKQVETEIEKYRKIKIALLQASKCIECCESQIEKEAFQNVAIEYSKELKRLNNVIKGIFDLKICSSCKK